jgi:predicted MFS family arabinose efflux permease
MIVAMAFTYGFLTSLQYTSMNTLAYADVGEHEASGSTIASTVRQLAVSFGIATGSLAAALFIPDRLHATEPPMIHGVHLALRCLSRIDHRVHDGVRPLETSGWRLREPA